MELILYLLIVQGIMGAFDLVYHHEMTEKLTWKPSAAHEMWLHGIRNGLYSIVFLSFGFYHWHGALAWAFLGILLIEVTITLWDFVIEDQTRKLPATERVTHTLLALNYGAVIGLFIPEFMHWVEQPTGFQTVSYGYLSWIMALYAFGVFLWFFRDFIRSYRLKRMARHKKDIIVNEELSGKRVLVTGGTGFIGTALCQSLSASGAYITVLTRSIKKAQGKFSGRVEFIEDLDLLTENDHFDIVIQLAGEPVAQRWTVKAKENIKNSRINTIENLLKFFSRTKKKPDVFISSSAIGWYGIHPTDSFTEDSPPSTANSGAFAKHICSMIETESKKAEKMDIRTILLRTGIVLEKDGGTLSELLFPFDFCVGGPLGNGKQWFSWIHRDDIIGLIHFAINNTSISGPLNGTAPTPVDNRSFATELGKAMKRPVFLPLPDFVLKLIFGDMAEEIMLNGQKVIPERAEQSGYKFRFRTLSDALKDIFAV